MPTATITSKGQVTVPKKVRELLHVGPGDEIDFVVDGSGRVTVQPATTDVGELRGLLHRTGRRPVPIEDMDAAIRQRHRRRR